MNKDYIYKRRLLKLADRLDTVIEKQFNFGKWVGDDWQGKQDLSCGTSACSLGWASTIPSFRKLGLRLFKSPSGYGFVGLKSEINDNTIPSNSLSFDAANLVFGLTVDEFNFLFLPNQDLDYYFKMYGRRPLSRDTTAKNAAKHIRFFVINRFV